MAKILSFAAYERALTASLGMQHTALCGILPGEQMLVRQIKSGTNRTKQTASGNTPGLQYPKRPRVVF